MTAQPSAATDGEHIRFDRLTGRYGCFHSFARYPIVVDSAIWPTMEHYVQAQKHSGSPHADLIRQAATPRAARKLANQPAVPPFAGCAHPWESVYRRACEAKFVQHPRLLATLLGTGEQALIGGMRDDQRNALGQILMVLRAELREPSFAARRAMQQLPPDLMGRPWVLFGHRVVALPRRPTINEAAVSGLHLLRHVAELARPPAPINDPTARWTTGLGTLVLLAAEPDPDAAVALVRETVIRANVEYVGTGELPHTRSRPQPVDDTG